MSRFIKIIFLFFLIAQTSLGCSPKPNEESHNTELSDKRDRSHKKSKRHRNNKEYQATDNQSTDIPKKVYEVLAYIRANDRAPEGYVGGRRFGNYEHNLPEKDNTGRKINYQEWDVNPKQQGRNRGAERLVTGSDGKAWFTANHYNSFVEVRE